MFAIVSYFLGAGGLKSAFFGWALLNKNDKNNSSRRWPFQFDEDSAYVKVERYKARFMKIFKKIAELRQGPILQIAISAKNY
jgi:hypothetical protein